VNYVLILYIILRSTHKYTCYINSVPSEEIDGLQWQLLDM